MFRMSVFQSVLERLKDEEIEPAEEPAVAGGISTPFVGNLNAAGGFASTMVFDAYRETAGEDMLRPPPPPPPPPKPVMPDHLHRIKPEEIAEDIALGEHETVLSLTEKRRRFAAENHPDRHPPDFRANATLRMKIANMLIDEALRRLKR
ncbi:MULTISPECIES: hypothetical protein [unclassified Rhizobium]|uniref:hypothetical protein n=1 Tax=unclassified Rhizobium TaxID=2613769 RepID=UPI0006F79E00|nr:MULTISPECIES: hypothetical protein [unclassified Rhizobium]KQV38198.1 hypothetical protein ASC86_08200 [Rhizobium sp. Root1212]KRD30855.1 hypothetical protein ASE37_08195 [Rhizobium sp. Root268]